MRIRLGPDRRLVKPRSPARGEPGTNLLAKEVFDGKRIGAGEEAASGRVEIESDRGYCLTVRARPERALLTTTVEGLVRFGGKWFPLLTKTETAPPAAEGAVDLELPFHPTAETPQVTHVVVRLAVRGTKGAVTIEKASLELAGEAGGE